MTHLEALQADIATGSAILYGSDTLVDGTWNCSVGFEGLLFSLRFKDHEILRCDIQPTGTLTRILPFINRYNHHWVTITGGVDFFITYAEPKEPRPWMKRSVGSIPELWWVTGRHNNVHTKKDALIHYLQLNNETIFYKREMINSEPVRVVGNPFMKPNVDIASYPDQKPQLLS